MGSWEVGPFDNDDALDFKEAFNKKPFNIETLIAALSSTNIHEIRASVQMLLNAKDKSVKGKFTKEVAELAYEGLQEALTEEWVSAWDSPGKYKNSVKKQMEALCKRFPHLLTLPKMKLIPINTWTPIPVNDIGVALDFFGKTLGAKIGFQHPKKFMIDFRGTNVIKVAKTFEPCLMKREYPADQADLLVVSLKVAKIKFELKKKMRTLILQDPFGHTWRLKLVDPTVY